MRHSIHSVFSIGTAALICLMLTPLSRAQTPAIDPEADRLLRSMSDYISGLQAFSVKGQGSIEMVQFSGQKLQLGQAIQAFVRRPDRLYLHAKGDLADQEFFINAGKLTILGKRANVYASTDIPKNLEEVFAFLFDTYQVNPPAVDLLQKDSYSLLIEQVLSGAYIGLSEVNGVESHHLAFRNEDVDWQIWIENSPTPLPRKYIITSKWQTAAPQFTAVFTEWNTTAKITDATFDFVPPEGIQRIEFMKTPAGSVGDQ